MRYIIRLMNKSEVKITESEYKKLGEKSGLVYIPSQDRTINTNSIVEIVNEKVVFKPAYAKDFEPEGIDTKNLNRLGEVKKDIIGGI